MVYIKEWADFETVRPPSLTKMTTNVQAATELYAKSPLKVSSRFAIETTELMTGPIHYKIQPKDWAACSENNR